jgi:CHAT domain-containing protein
VLRLNRKKLIWLTVLLLGGVGTAVALLRMRAPYELVVEYDNCERVGAVCTLNFFPQNSSTLRLWIALSTSVPVEALLDGRPAAVRSVAMDEGQRLEIDIKLPAQSIYLRALTPLGPAEWSRDLTEKKYPQWLKDFWKAKKNRDLQKIIIQEARRTAVRAEQGPVQSNRAKLCKDENRGQQCINLMEEAIQEDRDAGLRIEEVGDAVTLANWYIEYGRFAEARRTLDGIDGSQIDHRSEPAKIELLEASARGLLAYSTGGIRSALRYLEKAERYARYMGTLTEWSKTKQLLGLQFQVLGRFQEVEKMLEDSENSLDAMSCSERLEFFTNRGWNLLMAAEAGAAIRDPIEFLERAQEIAADPGCGKPGINGWINLALANVQIRNSIRAARWLDRARSQESEATPPERFWMHVVEARIALLDDDAKKALDIYAEQARTIRSPDEQRLVMLGQALAYRAMGRPEIALTILRKAFELLGDQDLQIPIDKGREMFLAQREAGTRLYIQLLLEAGKDEEALEAARRDGSRVIRQLAVNDCRSRLTAEERTDMEGMLSRYRADRIAAANREADPGTILSQIKDEKAKEKRQRKQFAEELDQLLQHCPRPSDELLPELRPDEVLLVYRQLAEGWVGFAAAPGQKLAVHRFATRDTERWLEPFRGEIDRARRVRVLAYGSLRPIPFHALPFEGAVLIVKKPVVYGLDLVTSRPTAAVGMRRAVVVSNPQENLPDASSEAKAVDFSLSHAGWEVTPLDGRKKATVEAVQTALNRYELLHYAGHGKYAGMGGWESELPLAGGSLTPGEILTLPKVPAWVVLAGCDTGLSMADSPAESLGLAQSFLLAGSRAVIGTTEKVGDRISLRLAQQLYKNPWSDSPDLAVLLQNAQRELRASDPDWASFRVFEP